MTSADHLDALPEGYRVQEYEFLSVLGVGGFGITYLARDTQLDRKVAIKEYLPRDFAVRTEDHSVRPRSSTESESYTWGLERFLDEARTLASLDHPSIIRIHKYFEAHGSGYIVMEYILHRDITPKNIMLRANSTPVLIDFGSARQVVGAHSRSVTTLVTSGYAPLEQYSTHGKQQGPWTDIYGLSAVAYRCVTGVVPKDATERAQGEVLTPALELAKSQYTEGLLTAVDQGLAIRSEDRPQDLKAWYSLRGQKGPRQTIATEIDKQRVGRGRVRDAENQQTCAEMDTIAQSLEKTSTNYAGFWRRSVALFLDIIFIFILQFPIFGVIAIGSLIIDGDDPTPLYRSLFLPITVWVYNAAFESSKKQATPGKMLLSIKVTDLEGNRIGFFRATGRHLGKFFSSILLLGFLMAAFSKKKQGLHDMIARCLVIKK